MDSENTVPPPPPPRMKASDLPSIDATVPHGESSPNQEQLPGYTITTNDSDLATLPPSQLFELNQAAIDDAAQPMDIPLMGALTKLDDLREEYIRGNQTFVKQINYLIGKKFLGVRRTRGDGDCFYRSFSFAYIERLLKSPPSVRSELVQNALNQLEHTTRLLNGVGYEKLVYEDFCDTLAHILYRIVNAAPDAPQLTQRGLLEAFNDAPVSNSIMMYMRYVTSAQIKADPMSYAPYLFHADFGTQMEPTEFCNQFVDPMGVEADMVQIVALSAAFKVNLNVAYLDGHDHPFPSSSGTPHPDTSYVNVHTFDNEEDSRLKSLALLYRPGHYDVLSEMSADPQEGLF